ncbi:MAG: universal stress protein, partial [Bacteroidota bacterium]|nr:universal stress protein [Bacteroidota bacterium]
LSNVNLLQSTISYNVKIKINSADAERATEIINRIKNEYGKSKEWTVEQLKTVRRIIIPVDFSTHSINACEYALSIAENLKAEIRLLHVYYTPSLESPGFSEAYSIRTNVERYIKEVHVNARYDMNKLIDRLNTTINKKEYKYVRIDNILIDGEIESTIKNEVKEYKPGLIVIGLKGKGENNQRILGSVTSHLVNNTNIPILAVPESAKIISINDVEKIGYATNFDDSDFKSISKLINFVRPFDIKIHCVHIETEEEDLWSSVKMNGLKEYFNELDIPEVECNSFKNNNLISGLNDYIKANGINILAVTANKRGFFSKLFHPSMTKEIISTMDLPLLLFHR